MSAVLEVIVNYLKAALAEVEVALMDLSSKPGEPVRMNAKVVRKGAQKGDDK